MASKKKASTDVKPVERGSAEFIGFVNITLTDDEMAQVDEADHDEKAMAAHMDYLLELGKLSFNYVRGSLNATLTVLEGVSAGYAVSAYSDTMPESVIILRLKVQNYLDKFAEIYAGGGTRKKRG